MMAFSSVPLQVHRSALKPCVSHNLDQLKTSISSTFKPALNAFKQLPMKIDVSTTIKTTSSRMLDAVMDSLFQFVDQPLLPSQSNFAPVEEIGEAIEVTCVVGKIPTDFPEGVYIRNGPNPVFGSLKSAVSAFGMVNHVWVEGKGMLHAIYFKRNAPDKWTVSYKNKFVETDTFKLEKQRNRPTFLPTIEGDSLAVLLGNLLNELRFGKPTKNYQNISVFEHSGKVFTTTENYLPKEIDIYTLESLEDWDVNGAWDRGFTSHPKISPGSRELVTSGVNGQKPYCVVGVISADGKMLLHKVDLKFNRSALIHEIGVTQQYNVILDHPLTLDMATVIKGGPLIKYEKEGLARIGVMPRYGVAEAVKWFEVKPYCTLHTVNCFDDGDEVVVRGCRAVTSIIPGPDWGHNKFEWFSRGFTFAKSIEDNADGSTKNGHLFHRVHEWRLNTVTGEVKEKYLTGIDSSMDFPLINGDVTGLRHKYAYMQVIDSLASASCGITKYAGLAKLYFEEQSSTLPVREENCEELIKVEYHQFPRNTFCTGSAFVPKPGGVEEDDGWIVTHVHNEEANVSQAYIIDAKKFESDPIAIITVPRRVPYGFHGVFISMPNQS